MNNLTINEINNRLLQNVIDNLEWGDIKMTHHVDTSKTQLDYCRFEIAVPRYSFNGKKITLHSRCRFNIGRYKPLNEFSVSERVLIIREMKKRLLKKINK